MIKKFFVLLGVIAAFGLGILVTRWFFQAPQTDETITNSTVLLEKVEQVCKLVTVEGNFSELYDETNIRKFTIYMPLPSTWRFSKQAIIKVTGKVLVGYDLKNLKVTADSTRKQVILSNIPEPEILSIDHNLEYKNLTESFFNSFEPEDYTALNANAKAVLRQKAEESRLMQEARLEGNQLIRIMQFIVESAGWTLVVEQPGKPAIAIDSLFQFKN
ncbi:MAG: DUF4230 domain-containing protein [Bacteroidetes bacterium]|jgi:hypothetical protein|nr:DUF4230 domain-containing protein [Bacteroidota bacterium]